MESLQILWFILWATLWSVYFTLDGFDLGSGILMNLIAKKEEEKTAIINSIGPFWDGNEVWLITAGGATFAAFPQAYAKMFSWFYIPLFLILISLILRGVSVELRSKVENKKIFDFFIFLGSFLATFLLGVAFGNLWSGVYVDSNGYTKGTIGLLNSNGILTGIVFVIFMSMHGALWLYYKMEGEFKLKMKIISKKLWAFSVLFYGIFIIFLPSIKNPNFILNSLNGYISVVSYAFAALFMILIKKSIEKGKDYFAFMKSFIFFLFFFIANFSTQYPNIIPSKIPEFNVSIFNSSSSFMTLKIMSAIALVFVPMVIAYQIWVYRLLNHKLNPDDKETLFY
jgi:cytochrome d ubiquinol oxidase subunit II